MRLARAEPRPSEHGAPEIGSCFHALEVPRTKSVASSVVEEEPSGAMHPRPAHPQASASPAFWALTPRRPADDVARRFPAASYPLLSRARGTPSALELVGRSLALARQMMINHVFLALVILTRPSRGPPRNPSDRMHQLGTRGGSFSAMPVSDPAKPSRGPDFDDVAPPARLGTRAWPKDAVDQSSREGVTSKAVRTSIVETIASLVAADSFRAPPPGARC